MLLIAVNNGEYKEELRTLYTEYMSWIGKHAIQDWGFDFTNEELMAFIEEDLGTLDRLLPPNGRLYLAQVEGEFVGAGAIKELDQKRGELKRIYVRPQARGLGVGKAILQQLIADGRSLGYSKIMLSSPDFAKTSHQMYYAHQFTDTTPYPGTEELEDVHPFQKWMQLDL